MSSTATRRTPAGSSDHRRRQWPRAGRVGGVRRPGRGRGDLRTRNVAGIAIVEIAKETVARARTDRGYSLAGTTARIDGVAERFEAVLDRLLVSRRSSSQYAGSPNEIARTTRRMNALEHVVVPRLEAERARIALVLEERETEDRVRLRRMRSKGAAGGCRAMSLEGDPASLMR